jgi:L,D-transpeptidase ErfK/SrfK
MRVTHGCIRMFPEDIEALYKTVSTGTPVTIVNQPYKLGWTAEGLYLEAHPHLAENPLAESDEPSTGDAAEQPSFVAEPSLTELTRAYVAATQQRRADVRWDLAESVVAAARGVPEFISVVPVAGNTALAGAPSPTD